MIIFLYGPDDYRRIKKKKEIVEEFLKKHSGLGFGTFDLEGDGAADRFEEFVRSQSIFENAKLAVLENAFECDAAKLAALLMPLAGKKGTTVLLAEKEKPVKKLSFLTTKPTLVEEFKMLSGAEWMRFVNDAAKRLGVKLAPGAAEFLGTVYAGASWALVTELEKLAAFRPSSGGTVEKRDLDVFDFEVAPNYWGLLNGMKSFDARTRLYALETLFAMNDPAPKLFNILAAQAGEKTPRMAEYDLMVKSGKLDYEEALLDLAIS